MMKAGGGNEDGDEDGEIVSGVDQGGGRYRIRSNANEAEDQGDGGQKSDCGPVFA